MTVHNYPSGSEIQENPWDPDWDQKWVLFFSREKMQKMNQAFEKVKMLVGMEVEDEEEGVATVESSSFTFMDDFNRDCTLSTKQVCIFSLVFNLWHWLFDRFVSWFNFMLGGYLVLTLELSFKGGFFFGCLSVLRMKTLIRFLLV